ncbi:hypothetical protein HDU76_000701 [Blyttiomyces sp. JEL0837]|nr:hypothetical protein HDU76_000701 [Blyttiomyces sp. JEL0837]
MIAPNSLTMTVLAVAAFMTQSVVAQLPPGLSNSPECVAASQKLATDSQTCLQSAGTDATKLAACTCSTDYYNDYKGLVNSCATANVPAAQLQQLLDAIVASCAQRGTPIATGGSGSGSGSGSTTAPVATGGSTPGNKSGANAVGAGLTLVASAAGAVAALFL